MGKKAKLGKKEKPAKGVDTSSIMKVIGVLADESVIYETDVSDQNIDIATATNTIANNLQTHINSTFSLRGRKITIDTTTALIPGVPKHDSDNTVAEIAGRLPQESPHMVILFSPIHAQHGLLTKAINEMVIDQAILAVDKNAAPWPSKRNGKLDQILELVKDLGQQVGSQSKDLESLKAQVGALEDENQVLREAVDGHTAALYKLRRRILLDQARKLILGKWTDNPKIVWNELRKSMGRSDLKSFILSEEVFPRPLDEDAFNMIYDGRSVVREDGNKVAHKANKDLVRAAVVYGDPGDRKVLENVFGCVYNEDIME